jgi:hypothetical protein
MKNILEGPLTFAVKVDKVQTIADAEGVTDKRFVENLEGLQLATSDLLTYHRDLYRKRPNTQLGSII